MSVMHTRTCTVRFLTPAFLGDAQQNGRWRTPPFKHLLREWWRVAWVAAGGKPGDIDTMRREEARLFGAAADGEGNRSLVRLRIEHWDKGRLRQWAATQKVFHKEVGKSGASVDADLYLGYGPLAYDKASKSIKLKANAAIQADEQNTLRLAFPDSETPLIDHALALIHAFGTLGGRSRNGWGSIQFEGDIEAPQLLLRDWEQCLEHEWAHAIGRDEQGALIWRTKAHRDWHALMKTLAEIKIGLCTTQFRFLLDSQAGDKQLYYFDKKTKQKKGKGIEHGVPQERHWLSYPVTNHSVKPWDQAARQSEIKKLGLGNRLPNSLRFKVRRDSNGQLYGVIFHMPCKPPTELFKPNNAVLCQVWRRVHRFLDQKLERSPV